MIINPKNGVDQLLFGMKQNHVEAIYGKPSKQFKDEDGNVIYHYNAQKISVTFYEDENYRLGYIACSNPEATILGNNVIGKNVESIKADLPFKSWSVEDFDSFENHFNESNWLILQTEYDIVIRVEIGAIIKDSDEFDWKFKG
ncbi:hypothetical protein IVB69_01425 [Flavobacterium sp. J49]|uniref:hypothetical protein n=1 Tax=Flavobacterium sp. J49 TaxID=2718534 RepID=UPI00159495E0|nr:hypothetical protein [Flavobacterium sp. J49]MBF6640130.1 hypothetical protein [Flavobacterium sp. J49]NIC01375.1 hypothetical protein [Flavobacterium sp. J49]